MKISRLGMASLVVMLCVLVLGRALALAGYTDNHNLTVTDTKTGLIWQQEDGGRNRAGMPLFNIVKIWTLSAKVAGVFQEWMNFGPLRITSSPILP